LSLNVDNIERILVPNIWLSNVEKAQVSLSPWQKSWGPSQPTSGRRLCSDAATKVSLFILRLYEQDNANHIQAYETTGGMHGELVQDR